VWEVVGLGFGEPPESPERATREEKGYKKRLPSWGSVTAPQHLGIRITVWWRMSRRMSLLFNVPFTCGRWLG
jgi:hypothetical protein